MTLTKSSSMGNDPICAILFSPCACPLQNCGAYDGNEFRSELDEKSLENRKKGQKTWLVNLLRQTGLVSRIRPVYAGPRPLSTRRFVGAPEKPATNQDPNLGFFKEFCV